MTKKAVIIGSGFAGLSAAAFMARAGWQVTVLEKHEVPGGRARRLQAAGFTFDMGPSFYWMPDVFERFFGRFGKRVEDYYPLVRLDPSYRVYWSDGPMDVPASYEAFCDLLESLEPGATTQLGRFLHEAEYKYRVGIDKLVYKPGQSLAELLDADLIRGLFRLDVFRSIQSHVAKHFQHPKIRQLLEFPVLFLGARPADTPALYSLMNYADIRLGTWYPMGGMYSVVEAMHRLAEEQGAVFRFGREVDRVEISGKSIRSVHTTGGEAYEADVVIGGADYHFIESQLLPKPYRSYSEAWWDRRLMAPGALLYYVGLDTRIPGIPHHSLFFDEPFEPHARDIYVTKQWPEKPLFYLSASSVTDEAAAPAGCENLVFLIPLAAGLASDTEEIRARYFEIMADRLQQHTGVDMRKHLLYKQSYCQHNFQQDYNAFKGNAYGLANTLLQTAHLKPSCRSARLDNLFYTGQLTVPGPGVPPSLISGEVVSGQVLKQFG